MGSQGWASPFAFRSTSSEDELKELIRSDSIDDSWRWSSLYGHFLRSRSRYHCFSNFTIRSLARYDLSSSSALFQIALRFRKVRRFLHDDSIGRHRRYRQSDKVRYGSPNFDFHRTWRDSKRCYSYLDGYRDRHGCGVSDVFSIAF